MALEPANGSVESAPELERGFIRMNKVVRDLKHTSLLLAVPVAFEVDESKKHLDALAE